MMPKRIRALVVVPFWVLVVAVASLAPIIEAQEDTCRNALQAADVNADGRIDSSEYPTFLSGYRPNVLEDGVTFGKLPLTLQSTFYTLACDCVDYGGDADCCLRNNAHLPVLDDPSRLQQICSLSSVTMSFLPTLAPAPTDLPTKSPTAEPTAAPTQSPITTAPTKAPTDVPTDMPTKSPTTAPTASPTGTPSMAAPTPPATDDDPDPTLAPTAAPVADETTPVPTLQTQTLEYVEVTYTALVAGGQDDVTDETYTEDLVQAMNRLATELKRGANNRKRSLLRSAINRQSVVPIDATTTTIVQMDTKPFTNKPIVTTDGRIYQGVGPCPADMGNPATDVCVDVLHQIPISVQSIKERDDFLLKLQDSVFKGGLQEALEAVAPNSVVTILSGLSTSLVGDPPSGGETNDDVVLDRDVFSPTDNEGNDDGDDLSGGAKFGIVAASFGLVGVVGFFLLQNKRGSSDSDNKDGEAYQEVESVSSLEMDSSKYRVDELEIATGGAAPSTPDRPIPQFHAVASPDQSAPESESGWSSSAGHSSRGTADDEDLALGKDPAESGMVVSTATGTARQLHLYNTPMMDLQEISSQNKSGNESQTEDEEDELYTASAAQIDQLERAIMVGDWSAVGASVSAVEERKERMAVFDCNARILTYLHLPQAAFLASSAAPTDSDSGPDISTDVSFVSAQDEWKSRTSASADWQLAKDTQKAVELDKLIEAGDWEAVISAAAKFESQDDEDGNISESDDDDDDDDQDVTTTATTAGLESSNGEGATSENPSRDQIAALLKQVVPEEMGNLDDMLEQFKGREDDLIETLKAMEQRHQSTTES